MNKIEEQTEIITCLRCGNPINLSKEKYVKITTGNIKDISTYNLSDSHEYFHFQCWLDFFDKSIEKKLMEKMNEMQGRVSQLLDNPLIKNMLPQFSNLLKGTINSKNEEPKKEYIIDKKTIKSKIDDDRKREDKHRKRRRK